MDNHYFSPYFSDHAIKAICWTLVHSLWIGLVVAALAGLVIAITKKSTASLRYNLLCALLLLFIAACGFAFLWEISGVSNAANAVNITSGGQNNLVQTQQTHTGHGMSYAGAVSLFNRFSGWIFSIWLLCFVFKSIKLTRELLYVQKVKRDGIAEVGMDWKDKVAAFSQKMGIRNAVTLLESELVKVPVTIGYLKPVILLPAGMLLQLPPGQIDTIILHELAHILRRDYLVNILQSVVETVFFFNPAIWWLSALIREERENCCDDMVLQQVQQKRNYLEALMAFQHYEAQLNNYAMGLSMRRHQLMNRLRRMVNQENQKLNAGEKIVLLTGMILLCICTFVPKANSEIRHGAAFIKKQVAAVLHPAIPVEDRVVKRNVKVPEVNAPATIPATEPELVQADTARKFTSILFNKTNADTLNRDMRVLDDKGTRYHIQVINEQLAALEINDSKVADDQLVNYRGLLQQVNQVLAQKRRTKDQYLTERYDMEKAKQEQARLNKGKYKKGNPDSVYTKSSNGFVKKGVTKKGQQDQAAPDAIAIEKFKQKHPKGTGGDTLAKRQQAPVKHLPKAPDNSADEARVRGVIAALVQEKVVSTATDVDWFGLSVDALIVNGQKQPEALHQKLKEAYGIKPQYGLFFGPSQMTGTGIHLDKTDVRF
ncbi:MAG: M56 family metallopeptidase [Bacteroidota bacterium]